MIKRLIDWFRDSWFYTKWYFKNRRKSSMIRRIERLEARERYLSAHENLDKKYWKLLVEDLRQVKSQLKVEDWEKATGSLRGGVCEEDCSEEIRKYHDKRD